jgi:hypothetical protein
MIDKSAWIPVSERLPEKNTGILIYDEFYERAGEGELFSYGFTFLDSQKDDCSITHWMPLPEPPDNE